MRTFDGTFDRTFDRTLDEGAGEGRAPQAPRLPFSGEKEARSKSAPANAGAGFFFVSGFFFLGAGGDFCTNCDATVMRNCLCDCRTPFITTTMRLPHADIQLHTTITRFGIRI